MPMPPRDRSTRYHKNYRYRPVSDDPDEVRALLERWAGAAVQYGFDIGTKEKPKGTPAERAQIAAQARVVFETLGVLPAGFQPPPEDGETTRAMPALPCRHVRCKHCGQCRCDDVFVRGEVCEECKWINESKSESGRTATTANKGASGRAS